MLLMPCPICHEDQQIPLEQDGERFRAPDLLPLMHQHVREIHDMQTNDAELENT